MIKFIGVFVKHNGLSGLIYKKIVSIRGGDNYYRFAPKPLETDNPTNSSSSSPNSISAVQDFMNDPDISDSQKRRVERDLAKAQLNRGLKETRKKFRESCRNTDAHPYYAQFKRKLPFVVASKPMFTELSIQSTYRGMGCISSPYTVQTYLGMCLPLAVTFSMLEMVGPNSIKPACKAIKWIGGAPFFLGCYVLDHMTAGIEEKAFGYAIPTDTETFMGTLPTENDAESMKALLKSLRTKSRDIVSNLGEKTYDFDVSDSPKTVSQFPDLSDVPLTGNENLKSAEQMLDAKLQEGSLGEMAYDLFECKSQR